MPLVLPATKNHKDKLPPTVCDSDGGGEEVGLPKLSPLPMYSQLMVSCLQLNEECALVASVAGVPVDHQGDTAVQLRRILGLFKNVMCYR